MASERELIWRRLSLDDAGALFTLIARVEAADASPVRTTLQEVASYFDSTHVSRIEGAFVGEEMVAFGMVRTPTGEFDSITVTLSGGVSPEWRSQRIGTEVVDRQLKAAKKIAKKVGADSWRVVTYLGDEQTGFTDIIERRDFTPESSFVQLRREIPDPSEIHGYGPETQSPYLVTQVLDESLAQDARREHNRILANTGFWNQMSKDVWNTRLERMESDWCLGVVDTFGDRPKLAGYMLASRSSSFLHGTSVNEGFIEELVVVPEWRGKHVAAGLITHVSSLFRESGMKYIGMDVGIDGTDADSNPLIQTFLEAGFENISQTVIMVHRPASADQSD